MKNILRALFRLTFLMPVFLLAVPGLSSAVTYNLRAAATTIAVPGSPPVPAWGFANMSTATVTQATVPGPQLTVPPGDTTLTINLTNALPVPVSIVIPGQAFTPPAAPINDNSDGKGSRVRSFATEAAANGGTATYTFTTMKPGTFLYESGTNPAVQISMGLYGAVVVKPSPTNAYIDNANVNSSYANEAVLIFGEIDPALNAAVSAAPTTPYSTVNYKPKYFLFNGKSFPDTQDVLAPAGVRTLLRFLNAGAQSHVPTVAGLYMTVIAEDGNLRNFSKQEFSAVLPAGKTLDAIVTNTAGGLYPLYDRSLGLTNGAVLNAIPPQAGGMMTFLNVSPPAANPAVCAPTKGDVNGDGSITVADALLVLQAAVSVTRVYIPSGDVAPLTNGLPCGNGTIDVMDAIFLLEKAAGLSPY